MDYLRQRPRHDKLDKLIELETHSQSGSIPDSLARRLSLLRRRLGLHYDP